MEREDDALYAIKNKIRYLEDVEEDIHQARREMDDILYHKKEVWRGEHAEHIFWQIEDEVNHYNQKTACKTNDIQTELNNEQKKHQQNLHALETKQQDITKEMRL
nr:hypothetical protein [Listeria monocytogenes]